MKLFSLTLYFCLFSLCGFCQIENFDLSKYELTDFNFRALENTLRLTGNYQNGKDQNSRNQNYQSAFFLNLNSQYDQLINSREEQSTILAQTKINYQRNGRKGVEPRYQFSAEASTHFDRKFFHKKNVFTGIGNRIYFSHARQQGDRNNFYAQVYLPFSAGIGRIENVTDAWLGIRLLNDLNRLSLMEETPDESQILTLAKFISKRQNLRFFDQRLKRIEDIDELDKFLRNNCLVNAQDARYFNSLYDQWLFGANALRQSGSAFSFRVSPYGTLSRNWTGQGQMGFGGFLGLEYSLFKPVSLKWQIDKSAGIYIGSLAGGVPNPVTGLDGNYSIESQVNLKVGYYPTSRTFLSLNLNSAYKISDNPHVSNTVVYPIVGFENGIYSQFHQKGLRFISNFQGEYYLTPQTRLSAGFYSNYTQNSLSNCGVQFRNGAPNDSKIHCLQLNYDIRFSHSFF